MAEKNTTETLSEHLENQEFSAESVFDPKKEWNEQVIDLITRAMGGKYQRQMRQSILVEITSRDTEYQKFLAQKDEVKTMKFEGGMLYFFDEAGKVLAQFNLAEAVRAIVEFQKHHDCDLCRARSKRRRIYTYRYASSWSERLERLLAITSETPESEKKRILGDPNRRPPEDPLQRQANKRMAELLKQEAAEKEDILASVKDSHDNGIEITAYVDVHARDSNEEEFREAWPDLDHSGEIDSLFREDPKAGAGYAVNPFREYHWDAKEKRWEHGAAKWTPETLRQLIQGSGFLDKNSTIYLSDVTKALYNDNYGKFKENLSKAGIPKTVLDLLDKGKSFVSKIPLVGPLAGGESPKDLQETYKRMSKLSAELGNIADPAKVPEEYREYYPHRKEIKRLAQILGDYVAYAVRLVNAISQLKYNPGRRITERDRAMKEFDVDAYGRRLDTNRNRVVSALRRIFIDGVETPEKYTSEIGHWFGGGSSLTFQDLNGETLTVEEDWVTARQSPDVAYKYAYEAAELQKWDETRKSFITDIIPEEAKNHLNYVLGLGIAAYASASPEARPLRKIMEDLKVTFYGRRKVDVQNLYDALKLGSLEDLAKEDTDAQKLIAAERKKFMRIGSVIYQKMRFETQERERMDLEKAEKKKQNYVVVKFSEEEADAVIKQLEQAKKVDGTGLSKQELKAVKETLVGGIAAVLPAEGAGVFFKYDLGNGWSLDLTGTVTKHGQHVGAGVGKTILSQEDFEVAIHAGPGYTFAQENSGWTVGGGVTATQRFEEVDVSVVSGGGALLGKQSPGFGVSLGVGFDWTKRQAKFEENLDAAQAKTHVDELDKSQNRYDEVLANPDRYPELRDLMYLVNNVEGLSDEARRDMFEAGYKIFKEGLEEQSADKAGSHGLEKLIPTGAGVGMGLVNGVTPVPYAYLEFNLISRTLAWPLATGVNEVKSLTEAQVTNAILERFKNRAEVAQSVLTTSGEITIDPREGLPVLLKSGEGSIDFSQLRQFSRFSELQQELGRRAKIFMEKPAQPELAEKGLMSLDIQEAHGNVEIYVDPELKDSVILIPDGGKLYLSVRKEANIIFKREDISFPFSERREMEDTIITISENPYVRREVVQKQAGFYLSRTPTTAWLKREGRRGFTSREKASAARQENIKDMTEFNKWFGDGKTDRLRFRNFESWKKSYEKLRGLITLEGEKNAPSLKIRTAVKEKIESLAKDSDFIKEFMPLSTEGFDYLREDGTKINETWDVKFNELTRLINNRIAVDPPVTNDEMNLALLEFTVASFLNIHEKGDEAAKEKYKKGLEKFERRMLGSILDRYYSERIKDPEKRKQKVEEAVQWVYDQLKDVDITAAGKSVERGTLFGSLVGMGDITGIRHLYAYKESDPKWGVTGEVSLDPSRKDTAGEVADFWLQNLSPYKTSMGDVDIPPFERIAEYNEYQSQMFDNLHSPFVVKLVPLLSIVMDEEDINELQKLYQQKTAAHLITAENKRPVQRLLFWCDRVRKAQLEGKTEIPLEGPFKIRIVDSSLSMGVYRECGNITGLMRENFALINENSREIYFAEMAEGSVDVNTGYTLVTYDIAAGAALPIVSKKEAKKPAAPTKPKPRRTPTAKPSPRAPRAEIDRSSPPVEPVQAESTPEPTPTTEDQITARQVEPPEYTAQEVPPPEPEE